MADKVLNGSLGFCRFHSSRRLAQDKFGVIPTNTATRSDLEGGLPRFLEVIHGNLAILRRSSR